jgi:hypothetical protein
MRKLVAVFMPIIVALIISSPASAATTTVQTVPFETTIIGCDGSTINLSGRLLMTSTVEAIPSGGFIVAANFVPQNIQGTDEFGRLYLGTGLTRNISVVVPAGGHNFTYVNRFHIVGTMGAPTFYVKETLHFTVTPSGDVVANIDQFSAECV